MIKYFTIEDLLKHYLQKKFHILSMGDSYFFVYVFERPFKMIIERSSLLYVKSSSNRLYVLFFTIEHLRR